MHVFYNLEDSVYRLGVFNSKSVVWSSSFRILIECFYLSLSLQHRCSRCSSAFIMSTWSRGQLKSGSRRNLPLFFVSRLRKAHQVTQIMMLRWKKSCWRLSNLFSSVWYGHLNLYQPHFFIEFAHLAHACVQFLKTKIGLCIPIWAPLHGSWRNNLRCHLLQDWFCDL